MIDTELGASSTISVRRDAAVTSSMRDAARGASRRKRQAAASVVARSGSERGANAGVVQAFGLPADVEVEEDGPEDRDGQDQYGQRVLHQAADEERRPRDEDPGHDRG